MKLSLSVMLYQEALESQYFTSKKYVWERGWTHVFQRWAQHSLPSHTFLFRVTVALSQEIESVTLFFKFGLNQKSGHDF